MSTVSFLRIEVLIGGKWELMTDETRYAMNAIQQAYADLSRFSKSYGDTAFRLVSVVESVIAEVQP